MTGATPTRTTTHKQKTGSQTTKNKAKKSKMRSQSRDRQLRNTATFNDFSSALPSQRTLKVGTNLSPLKSGIRNIGHQLGQSFNTVAF